MSRMRGYIVRRDATNLWNGHVQFANRYKNPSNGCLNHLHGCWNPLNGIPNFLNGEAKRSNRCYFFLMDSRTVRTDANFF